MAVVQHNAVDLAGPLDGDLVGEHGQHRLIDQPVRVGHPAVEDRVEPLRDERECRQCRWSSREQMSAVREPAPAGRRGPRCSTAWIAVEVGEVSVRGALGCAVEQPTRPTHPRDADVQVAAGEPGKSHFDGLHARGRRVLPGQLVEHPLGDAGRFLRAAQPPRGHRHRVEVVGVQRTGSLARVKPA